MTDRPQFILIRDDIIEGMVIAAGEIVGYEDPDGRIVATHESVSRGHIEARLRSGTIKIIHPPDVTPDVTPPPDTPPDTTPDEQTPDKREEQGNERPANMKAKRSAKRMVKPPALATPAGGVMDG